MYDTLTTGSQERIAYIRWSLAPVMAALAANPTLKIASVTAKTQSEWVVSSKDPAMPPPGLMMSSVDGSDQDSWTDATITWSTRPLPPYTTLGFLPLTTSYAWLSYDITAYVVAKLAAAVPGVVTNVNVALTVLQPTKGSMAYTRSKEAGSSGPTLVVTFKAA
jgi:hypothetical protein